MSNTPYNYGRCLPNQRILLGKRYFDLTELKHHVLYVSIARVYQTKIRTIRTASFFIIQDNKLRDITLEIADLFNTKLDNHYKLIVPYAINIMMKLLREKLDFDVDVQFPESY